MEEPIDLLMACHERIHRYLAGSEALVAFPDWSDPRAITTARDCAHYFREALPLHAQDEDESVAPRLRALSPGDEVDAALDQLATEHEALHELCAKLLDALDAVVVGRPQSGELQQALGPFATLLRAHLELEERLVFGHLDRLSSTERQAIVAEIRARRTG
jgi:hemerythrin-like domain-containing protein